MQTNSPTQSPKLIPDVQARVQIRNVYHDAWLWRRTRFIQLAAGAVLVSLLAAALSWLTDAGLVTFAGEGWVVLGTRIAGVLLFASSTLQLILGPCIDRQVMIETFRGRATLNYSFWGVVKRIKRRRSFASKEEADAFLKR